MKKNLLKAFCFFAFCFFYGCENPNDDFNNDKVEKCRIFGCVTDFATGEPIPYANVQLRPSGETTLTGFDGMYEFIDLEEGNYSIIVSKAEYTDLIDDYVISAKRGSSRRRDVQIEKIPTYIRFIDMNGNDITDLYFSANTSMDMQSFNIYNHGTVKIECNVVYSCNWIVSVSPSSCEIQPGSSALISVKIDRSKLATGDNTTKLYITSNNGSNVIDVKATSSLGNPPIVNISPISNITPTSALCTGMIQDTSGGTISDCGFCYGTTQNPSLDDNVVRLGPCTGTFSYALINLEQNKTYYVRSFAISNLGIGYSPNKSFTTKSGLPICGETKITLIDPTTVKGSSSLSANGSEITEQGFCWSTSQNPSIYSNKVKYLFSGVGDGEFSEYISSLQPNTVYFVRSYAINEFGTAYGPEMSFISHSGLATVTTKSPRLSGDEIITGGNVLDDAGTVVIDRGVCYGYNSNPNLSWSFEHTYDDITNDGSGEFTSFIPKPTESGYLYIRAYATTNYGTSYGEQVKIYIY